MIDSAIVYAYPSEDRWPVMGCLHMADFVEKLDC